MSILLSTGFCHLTFGHVVISIPGVLKRHWGGTAGAKDACAAQLSRCTLPNGVPDEGRWLSSVLLSHSSIKQYNKHKLYVTRTLWAQ